MVGGHCEGDKPSWYPCTTMKLIESGITRLTRSYSRCTCKNSRNFTAYFAAWSIDLQYWLYLITRQSPFSDKVFDTFADEFWYFYGWKKFEMHVLCERIDSKTLFESSWENSAGMLLECWEVLWNESCWFLRAHLIILIICLVGRQTLQMILWL